MTTPDLSSPRRQPLGTESRREAEVPALQSLGDAALADPEETGRVRAGVAGDVDRRHGDADLGRQGADPTHQLAGTGLVDRVGARAAVRQLVLGSVAELDRARAPGGGAAAAD